MVKNTAYASKKRRGIFQNVITAKMMFRMTATLISLIFSIMFILQIFIVASSTNMNDGFCHLAF